MLVFIDESGDPGVGKGSHYLVIAMIVFHSTADAKAVDDGIEALRSSGLHKREFKFSKVGHGTRDEFFECVTPRNFGVKAVVWNMHSPPVATTPATLYQVALNELLRNGDLSGARIRIDGKTNRRIERHLQLQMDHLNEIEPNSVIRIGMRDSSSDNLIQLADMVAGAISRSLDHGKKHHDRWANMLGLDQHDVTLWI